MRWLRLRASALIPRKTPGFWKARVPVRTFVSRHLATRATLEWTASSQSQQLTERPAAREALRVFSCLCSKFLLAVLLPPAVEATGKEVTHCIKKHLADLLISREIELVAAQRRRQFSAVAALPGDHSHEIGSSGRFFSKSQVLEALRRCTVSTNTNGSRI